MDCVMRGCFHRDTVHNIPCNKHVLEKFKPERPKKKKKIIFFSAGILEIPQRTNN